MGNNENGNKPCTERRRLTGREILLRLLPYIINIILFILLYAYINPKASAQEKMERLESRTTALEVTMQQFSKIEDRVNKIYEYLLGVKP